MSEKFQLKGGIYEPSSDIPPNWRYMRSKFGYTEVKRNVIMINFRPPWLKKRNLKTFKF